MERIEVTARFNTEGKITPLDFTWEGKVYPIESTGRQWNDEDGQHILVMVPGGRVFELLFSQAGLTWYLKQVGPHTQAA